MFYDAFTHQQHKGVGVSDINGNKISQDTIVSIYKAPKSTVVSKYDPNIIIDAVYPDRYLYLGISNMHKLIVYANNQEYECGYTTASESFLIETMSENGKRGFAATLDQINKIPNMVEHIPSGMFVHKSIISSLSNRRYERFPHPYIDKDSYKDCMKYGIISPTYLISEGKQYTFGVEIETCGGFIPSYVRQGLNMDCQYDGSITDMHGHKDVGGEYTTGVLRGDMGFAHLYKICYELSRRCQINQTCSIHVHIGNIIFNKEFIVLAYKLLESVEKELFNMMPNSRKTREHCRPIYNLNINLKQRGIPYDLLIDQYYNTIVKIISLGKEASKTINKRYNHPAGRYCNYDRSTPRYWWCNFVPALFNLKGEGNYTLEIRNHSASLSFITIRNWILIVMGLISFIDNHKREIIQSSNISVKSIMKIVYPNKGDYLCSYIKERTQKFNDELKWKQNEEDEYKPKNNQNEIVNPSIKNLL